MTPTGATRRPFADTWIAPALVVAVATAVFARALSGEFVWDDHVAVVKNPNVQSPASWLGLLYERAAVNQFGFVRPLRTLEFAFDRAAFGPGPLAFHVHSLLWHLAASVLLLFLLRRLLGDGRAALVGAIFWAVHPAQVETVAWIACRGDVAMAACVFASVLCASKSDGRDRWLAASLVCAALAPMYKETAVALPFVVAALNWTKRSRAPFWPYLAIVAAFLAYRHLVRGEAAPNAPTFVLGGSLVGTFATMFRGFGFYLADTLLPAQSADWYLTPSTSLVDAASLAWLGVHAALVASAFVARTRAPLWTLAVAWFYAFLLPVSNLPGIYVGSPTAERYLYVSLAGAALAVGWTLTRVPRVAPAALVVIVAFATASVARCGMWLDDDALWRAVDADHASPRADEFVADKLRAQAPTSADPRPIVEQSLARYHRVIAFWLAYEGPFRGAHSGALRGEANASHACSLLGRYAEALFHAEQAVAVDDSSPEAHYDRAVALLRLGFAPQAVEAMRRARERGYPQVDPAIAAFFYEAATVCVRSGAPAAARRAYEDAAGASPDERLRREAASRAATLPAGGSPDASERARIAELDAALAALPRSCPARAPVR
jgi:tetratricopeptide (TPR) repeat protein